MTKHEALKEILNFAEEWEATWSRDENGKPKDEDLHEAIQILKNDQIFTPND